MRRICIVTYYNSNNYGSRLQATALSYILNKMGYETCFLKDFKARMFTLRHPALVFARLYNRMHKSEREAFFTPIKYEISDKRKRRLEEYTSEHFRVLNINNDIDWCRIKKEKTIFVAGSDIIWQPANGYPSRFFLDFAVFAGLSCFSYASSLGALSLPRRYNNAYRRYLSAYKGIGVRENKTIELLMPIIEQEITKVVDPTLLLTKDDWDKFAEHAEHDGDIDKPYIFCYFVMNDKRYWNYLEKVVSETDLNVIVLPMHNIDEEQPYKIVKDGTPYEFIDLIRNAEFILTDSFHTCIFSIIYQKEFYLLRRARKAEDAKYDDLLGRYGLSDRTMAANTKFERKKEIDYQRIGEMIEKDRAISITFLKNTLAKC